MFYFSVVFILAFDSSTLEPLENRAEPQMEEKSNSKDRAAVLNRTRPQPCDQVIKLYTLYPPNKNKSVYKIAAHGCER